MIGSPQEAVEYLVQKEAITSYDLAHRSLVGRRSRESERVFLITPAFGGGQGFALKTAISEIDRVLIKRELAFFSVVSSRLGSDLPNRPVYSLVTESLDSEQAILVTALEPEAQTLQEHFDETQSDEQGTLDLFEEIGSTLATLHQLNSDYAKSWADETHLDLVTKPLAFMLRPTPVHLFHEASASNRHFLLECETHPALLDVLAASDSSWKQDALIHGDFKLTNVVVYNECQSGEGKRLRAQVIDFGLSGIGDARWDLCLLVADLVKLWFESIPVVKADLTPTEASSLALFSNEFLGQCVRRTLESYLNALGVEAGEGRMKSSLQLLPYAFLQLVWERQQNLLVRDTVTSLCANAALVCSISLDSFLKEVLDF